MKLSRHTALAACVAALLIPGAIALPSGPVSGAATALFAEGATRPSGEAQTAFAGAFCEQNTCRSLGTGTVTRKLSSTRIQAAVDATPGDLILVGYSVGAAGVYDRLRQWERDPSLAPDPERVLLIVTFGNPENKFGGRNRTNADTGLPVQQPYDHLDVVSQYDGVADAPTRFGFYSAVNSAFGQHFDYFDGLDINDPDNLVFQEGTTTYMLIPAETLPLVRWLQPFVTPERLAELDARYRPLVERDYDRPAYVPQGEGADWGNGTPPPSLSGSAGQAQALAGEAGRSDAVAAPEVELTATERRGSGTRGADVPDDVAADLEAGSETDVDEDTTEVTDEIDADAEADADSEETSPSPSETGSKADSDADNGTDNGTDNDADSGTDKDSDSASSSSGAAA